MSFPLQAPFINTFQVPCLITEAHVSFLLNIFFQSSEVFEVLMLRQKLGGLLSCWINVCSTKNGPADWTSFSIDASNLWDEKKREGGREFSATLKRHLFFEGRTPCGEFASSATSHFLLTIWMDYNYNIMTSLSRHWNDD